MKIPLLSIGKIKFSILGPEEISKLSEIEIKNHIIIQGNKPYDGGIYDLHMGTTDNSWECKTCKQNTNKCPGHYGSYKLKTNIFHPLFLQQIYNILKNICHTCGKYLDKKPKCPSCNAVVPTFQYNRTDKLIINVNKKRMHPFQVFNIFSKISQEDVVKLGFHAKFRPTYLVPDLLLIPPNTIRPDMQFILGKNSSNDITILIQEIVKINNALPNINEETITDDIDKVILTLNIAVYELIRGPYGVILPGKRVYEGALMNQISSKKGIIRKHLLGKHTRYMGRNVITCKSDLPIDVIGISKYIATRLQKKVYVRDYNFSECLVYYLNGSTKYPGASKIKQSGKNYFANVDFIKDKYKLKEGDILFRDLIDDDVVNFNRQPTLDRSSISSMKVRIFDDMNVTYVNVNICSLFNADFDGDQMNLQVPYSTLTENEININSHINKIIISAKNTNIQVSQVLDGLMGLRMLTYNDYNYDNSDSKPRFLKYHLKNLLHIPLTFDLVKKNITGRDIITAYLQTHKLYINFNRAPALSHAEFRDFFNYNNNMDVKIINGEMITGILDNPSVGENERNNIFHTILNQYGFVRATKAIFDFQQIALKYLIHYEGFSLSCRDFYINDKCRAILDELNNAVLNNCKLTSENYMNGLLIPPLGTSVASYYENMLISHSEFKDIGTMQLLKYTTKNNNLLASISSGTKGKMFNFRNTKASIGLITVGNSIIPESFSKGRSSCYSTRHETNIIYKGYVPVSYFNGLDPLSFLYHSCDSRNSIIIKALSTAEGGTRQRIDRKCLETFFVNNKLQVVSDKYILQFLYGGDAISPSYYLQDKIHILNPSLNYETFKEQYFIQHKDPLVQDRITKEYEYLLKMRKKYITKIDYKYNTPINITTLIDSIKIVSVDKSELNIVKTLDLIEEFFKKIHYVYYNDYYIGDYPPHIKHALKIFNIYLKSYLNIATLIRLDIKDSYIPCILQQIKYRLIASFIRYGTPIGSITTMLLNEPLMQTLLDSHHFSGKGAESGGKKMTTVDRVNEILSIKDTSETSSASMKIYLDDTIQFEKFKVEMFSTNIKVVKIFDICSRYQIINEQPGDSDKKDYDEFIKITNIKPYYNIIQLCIKIFINVLPMILHNITLENIYMKLMKTFPGFYIIYNSRFEDEQYIKIFITKGKYTTLTDIINLIEKEILTIKLKGINNILSAEVKDEELQLYDESTGKLELKQIHYIETVGTNLLEVLMLEHVDKNKTTSDSIIENYKLFGIIGSRNVILKNLNNIVKINIKHSMIYADLMTVFGKCTGVNRYGSATRGESVLTRSSDSCPISIITNAALTAKTDIINKASDAVIMGQIPKLGDNYNNFEIDLELYKKITIDDINEY